MRSTVQTWKMMGLWRFNTSSRFCKPLVGKDVHAMIETHDQDMVKDMSGAASCQVQNFFEFENF